MSYNYIQQSQIVIIQLPILQIWYFQEVSGSEHLGLVLWLKYGIIWYFQETFSSGKFGLFSGALKNIGMISVIWRIFKNL
jgi:hypothetical protein